MANIMFNETCNLKCPYCFANEFVGNGHHGEMDENAFNKAIRPVEVCDCNFSNMPGLMPGSTTNEPKR